MSVPQINLQGKAGSSSENQQKPILPNRKRKIPTQALESLTDRKTPRSNYLLMNLAKKPSTALRHHAEVGEKRKVQQGCRASYSCTLGLASSSALDKSQGG